MDDTSVDIIGSHLEGKNITICVTSGIAAIKVPEIIRELRRQGAKTNVFISENTKKIFGTAMFEWASANKVIEELTGEAEHIRNDDCAVIIPATLNVIGEITQGRASNAITTYISSAIGRKIPIIIVPAMHQSMWDNQIFQENLCKLAGIENIEIINPVIEEGKAKLANKEEIMAKIIRSLSQKKEKRVLVTAGPTRSYLDPVRFISNVSSGKLGIEIAKELYFKGYNVNLVLGSGHVKAPKYLNATNVKTNEEMIKACSGNYDVGIFAAAVTDFEADEKKEKIQSGAEKKVTLKPSKKIVQEAKAKTKIVFKLETEHYGEKLTEIGKKKLEEGYEIVIVNNLNEIIGEKHKAYIITKKKVVECQTKKEIAEKLVSELELLELDPAN